MSFKLYILLRKIPIEKLFFANSSKNKSGFVEPIQGQYFEMHPPQYTDASKINHALVQWGALIVEE